MDVIHPFIGGCGKNELWQAKGEFEIFIDVLQR
jgi:hypothetical protein